MAVAQPCEEGPRFGDLALRKRRSGTAVALCELAEPGEHRVVVVGDQGDVAKDLRESRFEALARLAGIEPVEVDVDEALPQQGAVGIGRGLADDPEQPPGGIPLHAEDRVGDEMRREALLVQFGQR